MATGQRKKQLGQFFTTDPSVQAAMCGMVEHRNGRAVEPSAGAGHLAEALAAARPGLDVCAVELDTDLEWAHDGIELHRGDFFTWASQHTGRFDVVFGNPPYVAWKATDPATRAAAAEVKDRYQDKANLYHLFIDRCIDLLADGGELVFIVPLEWCYTTSARPLREKIAATGALCDFIHCGESKLFADAAVPAILIFRYVKGAAQGPVAFADSLDGWLAGNRTERTLVDRDGRWMLLEPADAQLVEAWGRLGDQYTVRVGLVTGADRVFKLPATHAAESSCVLEQLTTRRQLEPFLYVEDFERFADIPPLAAAHLAAAKDVLIGRRIARFGEHNWWRYGALRNISHMRSGTERFFALAKTRHGEPFFEHPTARYFSGGVLGLFRKDGALDVASAVRVCNHPRFRRILEGMFLTTADKLSLQPATLEDAPFPDAAQAATLLVTAPPYPVPVR